MNEFENFNSEEKEVEASAEVNPAEELNTAADETPSEEAVSAPETVKKSSAIKGFFEYVETFCYALAIMMVLLLYVFRMVTVDGASMQHTLHHQDKLIISNLFYTPKTGDIVVINPESHKDNEAPIIKRVIATGGQTVRIDYMNWAVYVDGEKLDEPYIEPMRKEEQLDHGEHVWMTSDGSAYLEEFTVSEGMVFVMGDNRNHSRDSRSPVYGEMSESRILGKVVVRISPEWGFVE